MTKKYLEKTQCPVCSVKAYQEIEEDGISHFQCFACGYHYEPNRIKPLSTLERGITEITTTDRINSLPSAPLITRGIEGKICEEYGVKVEYSEETGEQKTYFFPRTKNGKLTGYQGRRLPKSFFSVGDTSNCELFGQSLLPASGKFLIITEGNEDCLAAKQLLRLEGKNYSVVSLPSGANVKAIKDNLEHLSKFESIVLIFDQDEPGQKAAQEAASLFSPGQCKIASLGIYKDCNEMLEDKNRNLLNCIYSAKEVKPDGIVSIEDIYAEATKPIEKGIPWPWPTLNRYTYGRRRKELYGFGAGTGAGKTEAFKEVIQQTISELALPVGLFFLEEHPAHTAKVVAGKICNKQFHIPDSGWTPAELSQAVDGLRGKVFFYNHFGQKDWKSIKSKIRYMVVSLGIKDIFLDHLTAVVADSVDVNKELEKVMADMAAMTQELDFTLYFISHLTRAQGGKSHEEGGRVTSSQFRGSGTISFWSNYLFGFERDQQAEDEAVRNTVTFRILKDRYTGLGTGITFPLYYNHKTGRFLEDTIYEF